MHHVRRRRISAVLVALALGSGLLLTTVAASAVTTAQLRSKTLSLSDLGAGWSVDHSTAGSVSNLGGCLNGLATLKKTPPKGVVRARVRYKHGAFPVLQETIEAGKGAPGRYRSYLAVLDSCKNISFRAEGITFTGSVDALPLATVGDSSHAFSVSVSAEGQTVGIDIVLFRAGRYDGELVYGSVTQDTATLGTLATEAVNKVEGKPVGPSTAV